MANEYRSELGRVLTHILEIPVGLTIEDVAVTYIQDHFPGSSEAAIREDVKEFTSQNGGINWPEFLKANHAYRREQAIEFERSIAIRRFIQPIQDELLREVLMEILDQPAPTPVTEMMHTYGFSSPAEMAGAVGRAMTDVNSYRYHLQTAQEAAFAQLLNERGQPFNFALYSEWQLLVQTVHAVACHRLKMMDNHLQAFGHPYSDRDWAREISNQLSHRVHNRFAGLYRQVAEGDRADLRVILRETARIAANQFQLPEAIRVRVSPQLVRRHPIAIQSMN